MNSYPKRGDVYWIKLDPVIGSETQKTRPGVVLSNDFANRYSPRVIIAPITSTTDKVYSFEAVLALPKGKCKVMLDQIRTVDKLRLGAKITSVTSSELHEIAKALKLALGLN